MSELDNFRNSLAEKTNAELSAELDALMVEEKQLDLEIKREQVAKIKAARQTKLDAARAKMLATQQFLAQRTAAQRNCVHRKGGSGPQAVINGQGTSTMYCVAKHVMPFGAGSPRDRTWVLCMRCGKEWHPPNPFNVENGKLVPLPASEGWEQAVEFPTDNSTSGSSLFFFPKTQGAI